MNNKFAFIFVSVVCWFTIAVVSPFAGTNNIRQSIFPSSDNHYSHPAERTTFSTDDESESGTQKRLLARCRLRFLVNRNYELSVITPTNGVIPGFISAHIKHLFTRYVVRKASLPGYYGFLFRLSPF